MALVEPGVAEGATGIDAVSQGNSIHGLYLMAWILSKSCLITVLMVIRKLVVKGSRNRLAAISVPNAYKITAEIEDIRKPKGLINKNVTDGMKIPWTKRRNLLTGQDLLDITFHQFVVLSFHSFQYTLKPTSVGVPPAVVRGAMKYRAKKNKNTAQDNAKDSFL